MDGPMDGPTKPGVESRSTRLKSVHDEDKSLAHQHENEGVHGEILI